MGRSTPELIKINLRFIRYFVSAVKHGACMVTIESSTKTLGEGALAAFQERLSIKPSDNGGIINHREEPSTAHVTVPFQTSHCSIQSLPFSSSHFSHFYNHFTLLIQNSLWICPNRSPFHVDKHLDQLRAHPPTYPALHSPQQSTIVNWPTVGHRLHR
jgi:hypothetical protein